MEKCEAQTALFVFQFFFVSLFVISRVNWMRWFLSKVLKGNNCKWSFTTCPHRTHTYKTMLCSSSISFNLRFLFLLASWWRSGFYCCSTAEYIIPSLISLLKWITYYVHNDCWFLLFWNKIAHIHWSDSNSKCWIHTMSQIISDIRIRHDMSWLRVRKLQNR